jgi:predicted DNA-binding protein with PD1-like motif
MRFIKVTRKIARWTCSSIGDNGTNVIAVNLEHGADNIDYIQAASNTRVIRTTIGELIKSLH